MDDTLITHPVRSAPVDRAKSTRDNQATPWSDRYAKELSRCFSLVELMVVIGIIGILAALSLPALNRAVARTRNTQCANNVAQLGLGLQQFVSQNDFYPLLVDVGANASGHFTSISWTQEVEDHLNGANPQSNPSFWDRGVWLVPV